ncbi:hypothetical protein SDC9_90312 [bioreactor metagenome]|uniref:Uncharacterized protein n=1 Tax=bioreactor metagenome TaxID=1076179 RepID=A0A644ZRX6_9ZZZZ
MCNYKNISLFILVVFITVLGLSGIALANSAEGSYNRSQYVAALETLVVNKKISSEQAVKLKAYFTKKEAERNAELQNLIDEIMIMGHLKPDQAEAVFNAMYMDSAFPESIDYVLNSLVDKKVISSAQSIKLYPYFTDKAAEFKGNMIAEFSYNTDLSVDEVEIILKAIHWSMSGLKSHVDLVSLVNSSTIIDDDIEDVMSYYKGLEYDRRQQLIDELITAAGLSRSQASTVLKTLNIPLL